MSEINVKRFVDINIQPHIASVVSGTRDTVVLFTSYGTAGTVKVIKSLAEAKTEYSATEASSVLEYLTVFFNHGGIKCAVYEHFVSLAYTDIQNLPTEYICITATSEVQVIVSDVATTGYEAIKALAEAYNAQSTTYGITEKLFFARATSDNINDASVVKNFVAKYSSVLGAQMTAMAYLSKIDVYGIDTVYDYAFTVEQLLAENLKYNPDTTYNITDTQFELLMSENMNVDIYLANAVRNLGGNCKDGAELTNNFVRIVLHQTLTDKLLIQLTQKLKSNIGIGKLYSTIAQELAYYLSNGYLTTDKTWTEETLTITYNNQSYTVIEKGTPLINGYQVKILPMSSLTDADKAAHKAPLIYVIIADQYGIRAITINGEVI